MLTSLSSNAALPRFILPWEEMPALVCSTPGEALVADYELPGGRVLPWGAMCVLEVPPLSVGLPRAGGPSWEEGAVTYHLPLPKLLLRFPCFAGR